MRIGNRTFSDKELTNKLTACYVWESIFWLIVVLHTSFSSIGLFQVLIFLFGFRVVRFMYNFVNAFLGTFGNR